MKIWGISEIIMWGVCVNSWKLWGSNVISRTGRGLLLNLMGCVCKLRKHTAQMVVRARDRGCAREGEEFWLN